MRVWVARAEPGAAATAARLVCAGHVPLVAPVIAIRPLPARVDTGDVDAIAFSSANGARAFAALSETRDLPAYAVGEATTAALLDAGFLDVRTAGGDVQALGARILLDRPGRVLIAGAVETAGDLAGALADAGVSARKLDLYETVDAPVEVPDDADAVLVHSPRIGRRLAALVPAERAFAAAAISQAAARPLIEAGWRNIAVAPFPDEPSLLKVLVDLQTRRPA